MSCEHYTYNLFFNVVYSFIDYYFLCREEIVEDAVVASSISESKFFVNIVLLLVWFNNTQSPLKQIINHGDITSGLTEDNRIITIIPVRA